MTMTTITTNFISFDEATMKDCLDVSTLRGIDPLNVIGLMPNHFCLKRHYKSNNLFEITQQKEVPE